ncbi:hypothetical protein [Trueperella bernardiae]|uniref:hypothetical protein n=1 Tax=Trueperella bernardiae TaxID=59561 RepID=UPI000838A124|nr:hypothetical protein [Trueperella bernardiae]OCW60379.1 hypothetical protein AKG36_04340 [Trueperella bernardiae]
MNTIRTISDVLRDKADEMKKGADLDPALVFLDSLAPGIAVDVGDFGAESEKGLLSRVAPSIADLPHGTPVARLWAEFGGVDETDGERGPVCVPWPQQSHRRSWRTLGFPATG